MPRFQYKAKDGPTKIVNGVIEAENLNTAISQIAKLGITPIHVDLATSVESKKAVLSARSTFQRKKIKAHELVLFTRQICDLVDASVPLLRTIQLVHEQTQNPVFKDVIYDIYIRVRDGSSLSDALAKHPQIFSQLYVYMVKAGEVGGRLEVVLVRLAQYIEKEQESKGKIKMSLAYPAFILVVGILAVFVLLTFVVPRLMVMFEDLNQALPLPTIILLNVSSFLEKYWWVVIALVSIAGYGLMTWSHTEKGKIAISKMQLKLPIIGNFIRLAEVGRFSRTLATLLETGVAINTALNSVWGTVENVILSNELKFVSSEVTGGSTLKAALKKCSFFPELAVNMISVGEETGNLHKGLYKIADSYERQTDDVMKTFISILGPMVLVFIVGVVGFLVIAMLLPIFQMSTMMQ